MKFLFAGLAAFLISACTHCPPGHMKNGKCVGAHHRGAKKGHHKKKHYHKHHR